MVGELHTPAVYDRDAAATQIIQCVRERWKATHPVAYKGFAGFCDKIRKAQRDRGYTETREMKVAMILPPYVQHMVARIVGDTSWNFHEETLINAYLREFPCARIDGVVGTPGHSVLTTADKNRTS